MTDGEKIDNSIDYLKKALSETQYIDLQNAALHGSLVQDRTISASTDADILFEVADDFNVRMRQLVCIWKFVQATHQQVKMTLGAKNQARPVSPTILSESEIRWAIVKTKHSGNFFQDWTPLVIKGQVDPFSAWREQAYRVEYFHQEPTPEIEKLIYAVKTLQKLRADFCYGQFLLGNADESQKDFNNSYSFFFADHGSNNANERASRAIVEEISEYRKSAKRSLDAGFPIQSFNDGIFDVLVVYEYLLPKFLGKLESLVPNLDRLIEEYNRRLKANWESQWRQTED
jgi:hypothetical protein